MFTEQRVYCTYFILHTLYTAQTLNCTLCILENLYCKHCIQHRGMMQQLYNVLTLYCTQRYYTATAHPAYCTHTAVQYFVQLGAHILTNVRREKEWLLFPTLSVRLTRQLSPDRAPCPVHLVMAQLCPVFLSGPVHCTVQPQWSSHAVLSNPRQSHSWLKNDQDDFKTHKNWYLVKYYFFLVVNSYFYNNETQLYKRKNLDIAIPTVNKEQTS